MTIFSAKRFDVGSRQPEIFFTLPSWLGSNRVGVAYPDPRYRLLLFGLCCFSILFHALASVFIFYGIVRRRRKALSANLFGYGTIVPLV